MKKITIAMDGYSACGKSSTAKALAKKLGYVFLDTGAMYRAVTLYFIENSLPFSEVEGLSTHLKGLIIQFQESTDSTEQRVFLNGRDVTEDIRSMKINQSVSEVAAIPSVRKYLVDLQKKFGREKGVVAEGRDIGTVVFPDAELKFFMTAREEVRAERRKAEFLASGLEVPMDEILANLRKRDHIDSTRNDSPLRKAVDALEIDTSDSTFEEQIEKVASIAFKTIENFENSYSTTV